MIILLSIGCKPEIKKPLSNAKQNEEERVRQLYTSIEKILSHENEKLQLTSIIYNIDVEKIYDIIKEYYVQMPQKGIYDTKSTILFKNFIKSMSEKNLISEQIIASIIFTYIYEVRTKEEIVERYIEDSDGFIHHESEYEYEK